MYLRVIFSLALAIGVIVGAGWLWLFGPYYMDAWKMENCVGDAALTWANLGIDKGKDQLRMSMDERSIGDEIDRNANCRFYEEEDVKIVECEWEVIVDVPGLGKRKLSFDQYAGATRDGRLAD